MTIGFCSLIVIITVALIIAFIYPIHNRCFSPTYSNDSTKANSEISLSSKKLLSTNGEPFPWTEIRLPQFIVPFRYNLFMRPNMTTFYNKGSVDILLKVTQKTDFLVIHVKKLNITEILMTEVNGANISIIKHLECLANEQLFIKFDTYLIPNNLNYSLRINFERQLEEQLEGFYVSSYLDTNTGHKRYLLTTHFEPTSARSAFPCFDEPAMKGVIQLFTYNSKYNLLITHEILFFQIEASFLMNMVHESNYSAFFNSELNNKIDFDSDNLLMSIFEETVPMSTYLVAFIVCDFHFHAAKTKEGIDVRAVVPGDQISQAEFALESATAILSYFQEFFNVTYPLTKLDLVAVPDFGAGAMENWGLVTFRTTMFLFNINESSSEAQEQVAIVVGN
jgi:aminopeptidase N